MEEMMNNPMFKEMMNNPEMMKQAMNMMNPGASGTGSTENMQNMMKNPSMANLLNNPEMLTQCVNMLKNNPAMMQTLSQQIPGVDPQTMVKGLEWLSSLANYYSKTRSFFANKFVQLFMILSVVAVIFYYFGRRDRKSVV